MGEIAGMSEALERLVDRYPWLSDEPATSDHEEVEGTSPHGAASEEADRKD